MSARLLAEFGLHESDAMVAAALEILASLAGDADARQTVLAPWAWDLRQTARSLDARGARAAAAEAKAIARVVSAVALGVLSSAELVAAAAAKKADDQERLVAIGVLRVAMTR